MSNARREFIAAGISLAAGAAAALAGAAHVAAQCGTAGCPPTRLNPPPPPRIPNNARREDWKITIEGSGCHHNNLPNHDADLLAKGFVEFLRRRGQAVTSATITCGGKTDLMPAENTDTVDVRINGSLRKLPHRVSYEDVVSAAGFEPSRILSVVYTMRGEFGTISEGSLVPGQTITLMDGARIGVADTSSA